MANLRDNTDIKESDIGYIHRVSGPRKLSSYAHNINK